MADKLENLVNRLEKTTGRLESIQTDKLESLVDRLEKAIGKIDPTGVSGAVQVKSPVQSQPQTSKAPAFNAFDSVYNELEEKAKASGNQDLINLVNMIVSRKLHYPRQISPFKCSDGQMLSFLFLLPPRSQTMT